MGKTETIKNRAVYVYPPSLEMVEDWRAGVSFSKFIIERVEDSIRREDSEEDDLNKGRTNKSSWVK